MDTNILRLAEAYMSAWQNKDLKGIAERVHPKVHFKGPMAEFTDRQSYLASCERIFPMLIEIKIRSRFFSENQAIFTYDFICPEPIGICPTAELLTIEDDLIKSIKLFYDARPFEKMAQSQNTEK